MVNHEEVLWLGFLIFPEPAGRQTSSTLISESQPANTTWALEQKAAPAVDGNKPKYAVRLDDLNTDAITLLYGLPGVARVEVAVKADRPTARIVHMLDLHAVPRELHAADVRAAAGRPLTDEEVAALHDELLLEVELVRLEHTALLRCLVKHHGLNRILAEGLTPAGQDGYGAFIDAVRRADADDASCAASWSKCGG
jgi:hypothetical protein